MSYIDRAGGDGLDARVGYRRVQCHAAPTADAQNADFVAVHEILQAEIIHSGAEIFGIDVGRGHIAWLAARFADVGRVKGQGNEATFRQRLRIQSTGLFLDCAKSTSDGNRGQLRAVFDVLRHIEITGKGDAVAVFERHLVVLDPAGLREDLVPFAFQLQGLRAFHGGDGYGGVGHGVCS